MDKGADQKVGVPEMQARGQPAATGADLNRFPNQCDEASALLLGRARRKIFQSQPEQFANAGVLLAGETLQHRALIGRDANGNLAVRIARRLTRLEIITGDRSADDFAGRPETVSATTGLNPGDQRFRQIKRERGGRLARFFGHTTCGLQRGGAGEATRRHRRPRFRNEKFPRRARGRGRPFRAQPASASRRNATPGRGLPRASPLSATPSSE